jgi:hypothetical protein
MVRRPKRTTTAAERFAEVETLRAELLARCGEPDPVLRLTLVVADFPPTGPAAEQRPTPTPRKRRRPPA